MIDALRRWVLRKCVAMSNRRPADYVVGSRESPYLRRWYVIRRNPVFNIYFHEFRRSDDDRAPHDHMYVNLSWLLEGRYIEWVGPLNLPVPDLALPHVERREREQGAIVGRMPSTPHRIQLYKAGGEEVPVRTLFITGPRVRDWGFWCPKNRWVHWRDFTRAGAPGEVGKGCD